MKHTIAYSKNMNKNTETTQTSLTFSNENGDYKVSVRKVEISMPKVVEMVRSVLLAAGYNEDSINKHIS